MDGGAGGLLDTWMDLPGQLDYETHLNQWNPSTFNQANRKGNLCLGSKDGRVPPSSTQARGVGAAVPKDGLIHLEATRTRRRLGEKPRGPQFREHFWGSGVGG